MLMSIQGHQRPKVATRITVCFVIDSLSRAGTESQLLALIRGLDRSRVQPVLCLLKGKDSTSQELLPKDCPTIILGLDRLLGPQSFRSAQLLRRFWKKHHVNLVQTYFLDSTYFAVPLARLSGIRRVVRVRNNVGYWLTAKHRFIGKIISPCCSCTLTNSESAKQALVAGERVSEDRVSVITNGVDLDRFPITAWPNLKRRPIRLGMVSNLRAVKNVDGLIRAVASIPELTVEIAGEGEQRTELQNLITQLRLSDRVKLVGSVSDVPSFLGQQDIAVLPSHSESLSNAVLEYMAAGRVIIATNVGANATLIRDGIDGRIVPVNDDSLTNAIRETVSQPEISLSWAKSARRRVEECYSRAKMIEEFHQFYESLMES